MMQEIKVPPMGESVNEATIAQILKPSGSMVQMDEEILELETDKVNQVLTAPRSGKLTLTVKVDDTVTIGQVVGTIEESAEAPPPQKKEEAPPPPPPPPPTPGGARITEAAFVEEVKGKKPPPTAPSEAPRETRTRMTKIRKTIASRLVEAQATTAMLTTFNEIDMSAVMAARAAYKELFPKKHEVKLGFMSWFVKGCVVALKELPGLNSSIDGEEIVHREYYDIGIAVGTERGLMVPVVRDCDKKSFAQIEADIMAYAKKAREGGIRVEDLQGGGFTITNGGIYGSLLSTPILNTPQSGILGMHKIQERPITLNGETVSRPMMYVALSYDHRIVDGQEAVTFLVRLKECLEDPVRMLIDV
ncbi:MAG: dihydrolipoyllysine-residue succinyltransferase [Parachlamydiales bacterium]